MTDLDQLEHIARNADAGANELDAEARGPELDANGQPLPPPPDFSTEATAMVDMGAAMLAGYAPRTATVWTPAAKARTAAALAPVLEKYGFTFGGMPCEVVLLITAGPLLWQSSRLVAEQINHDRAEAQRERKDFTLAELADKKAPVPEPVS